VKEKVGARNRVRRHWEEKEYGSSSKSYSLRFSKLHRLKRTIGSSSKNLLVSNLGKFTIG